MSTQDTSRIEPDQRSSETTPDVASDGRSATEKFFQLIEKNRGRLQVLVYACFGLAGNVGREAANLTYVIDDVLTDLDWMAENFIPCHELEIGENG